MRLCREFRLDPLGTLASGAVLIVTAPEDAIVLCAVLSDAGYPAQVIGWVTPAEMRLVAQRDGERVPWPVFPADEITRLFG